MTSLFRRRPDAATSDYTRSHIGRGEDYDENFETLPMRALMWDLEQAVMTDFARMAGPSSVLDLACGTGRITRLLAQVLPQARVTGVDVAESMLDVARRRAPTAQFICSDVRGLSERVAPESVDLVTAFRFFPNAEPALRESAAAAVHEVLRPGGFVVLNNHRNFWSPSYLLRRAWPNASAPGALNRSVLEPFVAHRSYGVVARSSLGLAPHTEASAYGVSDDWAGRLERFNQRRLSALHSAGTNTIWLLQKPSEPNPEVT